MANRYPIWAIALAALVTFGCSYNLKYIQLDEKSDSEWTELSRSTGQPIMKSSSPANESHKPTSHSGSVDILESGRKLRELKKLRDEGLLTEEEFERKRKTIVDGL